MTAHLTNPQQFKLFHGSPAAFLPGDTIDPTPDRIYEGPDKAYATKNIKSAGTFSGGKVAHDPAVYPMKPVREWMEKNLPLQGQLFSPIYGVEPIGETKPSPSGSTADVTSEKGFKVLGIAGYQRTDDMGKHPFDQELL